MGKIHVLPESVVSHIAAGEVIERPCYVVKELIENAIDANADSIHIQIEESGLKKIVVTDTGEGMDPTDIALCFQPHTTSKILSEHDLTGVRTLGFRGEALSSIAAVSDLKIKSRDAAHPSGIIIDIQHGSVISTKPIGMPQGTSITVERLFSHVPARKKFLKSERTEFRLIVEVVSHLALAHPEIHFFLSHNNRLVLDFPKDVSLPKRLEIVLGESDFSNFIPIKHEDSYISISGYISRPQLTSKNFSKHVVVINKRYVSDSSISRLVKQTYGNLLEPHSYPVFLLHITIPHEIVDVNIHPRKEQVTFTNIEIIYDAMRQAIAKALQTNNHPFEHILHDGDKRSTQTFTGLLLKDAVSPWQLREIEVEPLQLHNLYIVVPTKAGILFVDQHAAHERILYEQFKEAFQKKQSEHKKYVLKQSVSIDLSPSDAELLLEYISLFENIGFSIEQFAGNTFVIREVPLLFQGRNYKNLIVEMLENISLDNKHSVDSYSDKILKFLACRGAIKAGDSLTSAECRELLQKLEKTANNTTCPHGRPTKVELPLTEFHRMFKR